MPYHRPLLAALASLALSVPALATTTAIDLPDASALDLATPQDAVWGWEFSPTVAMSVTALGIYDQDGDGLNDIHTIAIWSVGDGSVLTQQLFAPGTGAPLDDGFRYIDIAPVDLVAGDKYVIGVFYPSASTDAVAVAGFDSLVGANPFIAVLGGRRSDGGFAFPALTPDEEAFGPNIRFTPVPLPGAVSLMLGGLAVLGRLSRRS